MPNISESSLLSFMPSVAWTLFCATNATIPEWIHQNQSGRTEKLLDLITKQDERVIDWLTELAKTAGDDGRPWLDLVEALKRYRWDETAWRQERLEAILSLVIYCKEYPADQQANKHLEGELHYWEIRYGELGFKSFDEWKHHWEYWLGQIEEYEDKKLFSEDASLAEYSQTQAAQPSTLRISPQDDRPKPCL